jgi:hypothetical protein
MITESEIEPTPAMIEAGVRAYRLFDRATDPAYVVWAVYTDMVKAKEAEATITPERFDPVAHI